MTYIPPRESNWKVMIKKECWVGIRILMMPACPGFQVSSQPLKNWRAIKSSPLVRTPKAETYWPSYGEVELTPG